MCSIAIDVEQPKCCRKDAGARGEETRAFWARCAALHHACLDGPFGTIKTIPSSSDMPLGCFAGRYTWLRPAGASRDVSDLGATPARPAGWRGLHPHVSFPATTLRLRFMRETKPCFLVSSHKVNS